jgi:hypothetical protein
VLRGSVEAVGNGPTAVRFHGRRVAGPTLRNAGVDGRWVIAGADWSDGTTWHDTGSPRCLAPGQLPQPVDMGVVEAARHGDAPGRAVVVWVRCLRRS